MASSVRHECGSVWHESVSLPIRVQNKTAMQSIPQLLLRMGERAIMAHHQFMVKLEQGLLAYLFVDPKLPTLSEVESWRGQLGIGGSKCISTGLNPRLELWGLTEELGVIEKLVTALIDAKKHSGLSIVSELKKARSQASDLRRRISSVSFTCHDTSPLTHAERAEYHAHKCKLLRRQIDEEETKKLMLSGTFDRATNKFHVTGSEKAANRKKIEHCCRRIEHYKSQLEAFGNASLGLSEERSVPLLLKLQIFDALENLKRADEELDLLERERRSFISKCMRDSASLEQRAQDLEFQIFQDLDDERVIHSSTNTTGEVKFIHRQALGAAAIARRSAFERRAWADAASRVIIPGKVNSLSRSASNQLFNEYLCTKKWDDTPHCHAMNTSNATEKDFSERSCNPNSPQLFEQSPRQEIGECAQPKVVADSTKGPYECPVAHDDAGGGLKRARVRRQLSHSPLLPTPKAWSPDSGMVPLPFNTAASAAQYDSLRLPLDGVMSAKVTCAWESDDPDSTVMTLPSGAGGGHVPILGKHFARSAIVQ